MGMSDYPHIWSTCVKWIPPYFYKAFVTLPALIHLVHTFIFFMVPSNFALTRCKFILNFLLVFPVIFRPTPPFHFANPLRSIWFPTCVFLPHIKHTCAINHTSTDGNFFPVICNAPMSFFLQTAHKP